MSKIFIIFLFFLGIVFFALIISAITLEISTAIRKILRKKRKEYEYKHRFDKIPTSECYCVDCWHLDKEKYVCRKHNIYVTDDSFCNNADPN